MAVIRRWWLLTLNLIKRMYYLLVRSILRGLLCITRNVHSILVVSGFIVLNVTIYQWNQFIGGIFIGLTMIFLGWLIDRANR